MRTRFPLDHGVLPLRSGFILTLARTSVAQNAWASFNNDQVIKANCKIPTATIQLTSSALLSATFTTR